MTEKTETKSNRLDYLNPTYHINEDEEEINKKLTLKEKILKVLDSKAFHYAIIGLVMLDLVIILAELLITLYAAEGHIEKGHALHKAEQGLTTVSLCILCIFVTEILIKLVLVGPRYLFNGWHLLDAVVVIASFVLEIYVLAAPNPFGASSEAEVSSDHSASGGEHHVLLGLVRRSEGGEKSSNPQKASAPLVIIRLWKFIRIIHAVAHSVEMKNKSIIEKIKKEHNVCDSKIRGYMNIIQNLTKEVEDTEKKIGELEHLIRHKGEYNNNTN